MNLHQIMKLVERLRAEGRVVRLDLYSSFFWIDEIVDSKECRIACGPVTDY